MEQVSWDDAQKFLKMLNQMEKTDTYRLPTEAEWEYACRAGGTGEFCFGDDAAELEKYAWYDKNSASKDPSGGSNAAQCLGPLRYARQRLGMVPGLVRGICRWAGGRSQRA